MLKSAIDRNKFETLIEINALINSEYSDGKELLRTIIESATRLIQADASSLLLVNPENNKLYFEIALGPKGPEVQRFSVNMGEGIAGWVAANNRSLIVNDVQSDSRFFPDISEKINFPTKSILAVPMRVKDRCVGVIEIINKIGGGNFSEEDLEWLEIFAIQAAIAVQNSRSLQRVQEEITLLQDELQTDKGYHTFIGESRAIRDKLDIALRASRTDSSVLLLGESGVGKELFAEQIHLHSPRSNNPLIRVNCAALPENLLESELFGHVKGAFTGASSDRRGRFELADRGTIFLDEIGDLPLNLQVKLLRVIQHRMFERVGGTEPLKVDVRIIAATNKDIEAEVENGRFRADLYYRLNVLPIYIPPLRERRDDIPVLAEFFLRRFNREIKKQITGFAPEAMEVLLSYSWPGNVRELENAIERAVVITQVETITPDVFVLDKISESSEDAYSGRSLKEAVNIFKKHYIRQTLDMNRWNQTKTARLLGIQRTYLSRLIKELSINR
ncbi:MAG: sigma 54-interacting transcriptional regulator [Spirochaetales bacterium]|nr:sigma 54-interacting transcriptional regulator [Spirochaetales bacterium]